MQPCGAHRKPGEGDDQRPSDPLCSMRLEAELNRCGRDRNIEAGLSSLERRYAPGSISSTIIAGGASALQGARHHPKGLERFQILDKILFLFRR